MINELLRYLTRKKVRVVFNDLSTIKPVSTLFGFDRGTPIDRYYVEGFLKKKTDLIKGRVLEIARVTTAGASAGEMLKHMRSCTLRPGTGLPPSQAI